MVIYCCRHQHTLLRKEAFRVNRLVYQLVASRKRRIAARIRHDHRPSEVPMLAASNIQYELSARDRGLACGGIGAVHLLARRVGLIDAIDRRLHLLEGPSALPRIRPRAEHRLQHPGRRRRAWRTWRLLRTRRSASWTPWAPGGFPIPPPPATSAGASRRRMCGRSMEAYSTSARKQVWTLQEPEFFRQAILDADGTLAPTTGECKQGMDIAYDGTWGYHPLVVSLANTKEPLYLVNRSGNRPSHEGAAACFDKSIVVCRDAGFKSILLRGDTDFQSDGASGPLGRPAGREVPLRHRRHEEPDRAGPRPCRTAAWKRLERPAQYDVKTAPRNRPENVKEQIVKEREYREHSSASARTWRSSTISPVACQKAYRVVVVRKNLSVEKGDQVLFDDVRYFFYITNIRRHCRRTRSSCWPTTAATRRTSSPSSRAACRPCGCRWTTW